MKSNTKKKIIVIFAVILIISIVISIFTVKYYSEIKAYENILEETLELYEKSSDEAISICEFKYKLMYNSLNKIIDDTTNDYAVVIDDNNNLKWDGWGNAIANYMSTDDYKKAKIEIEKTQNKIDDNVELLYNCPQKYQPVYEAVINYDVAYDALIKFTLYPTFSNETYLPQLEEKINQLNSTREALLSTLSELQ